MTPPSEQPARFDGHHYPQVIPEPEDIEPGAAAPWSSRPPSSRSGITLAEVRDALKREGRLLENPPASEVSALSVVGDASPTPITRALGGARSRSSKKRARPRSSSRGERSRCATIAVRSPFPAGVSRARRRPSRDALREAREEVGLDSELVTPRRLAQSDRDLRARVRRSGRSSGSLTGRPELTIDPTRGRPRLQRRPRRPGRRGRVPRRALATRE